MTKYQLVPGHKNGTKSHHATDCHQLAHACIQLAPRLTLWSLLSRIPSILHSVTFELLVFMFKLSYSLDRVATHTLYITKICRHYLNQTEQFCKEVTHSAEEVRIEQIMSDYHMYTNLIDTFPCIFFALFLGPWSDKHGRKVAVALPFIGGMFHHAFYFLNSSFMTAPPEYLLLSSVARGLTGGGVVFTMGVLSYITDVSSTHSRTTRIALIMFPMYVASPIGVLAGGWLFAAVGYQPTFLLCTLIKASCLLYIILFVNETSGDGVYFSWSSIKDFFDLQNVNESFRACTRWRGKGARSRLYQIIICSTISKFPQHGENDVMYLFTRMKFGWTPQTFSYFVAFDHTVGTVGALCIVPLMSTWLCWKDSAIGTFGYLALITADLLKAVSVVEWMLFAASMTALPCPGIGVVIRSMVSKIILPEESSRIFSMMAMTEHIFPLIADVMYTRLYKHTLTVYPGAVFYLSASITIIPLSIFGWMHVHQNESHEELQTQREKTRIEFH